MIDFVAKKDATAPWEFTLSDDSGAVNLTGNQSVKIWLRNEATGVLKVTAGTCTVVTAATGAIKFAPSTVQVDTAGTYEAEFEVIWSDGTSDKFPSDSFSYVRIVDDLEA